MSKGGFIAVLSDIVFEPHISLLVRECFGDDTKVAMVPYGEHQSFLYQSMLTKADITVVWLDFNTRFPDCYTSLLSGKYTRQELIENAFGLCRKLYGELLTKTRGRTLWFLFEDYFTKFHYTTGATVACGDVTDDINRRIVCAFPDITFIDTKRLIAQTGITDTYDARGRYRWNAPYTRGFLTTAVTEIHRQYLAWNGITKKCLVLDCDNVLWGGIISEDGIGNIRLGSGGTGRVYQDFQRYLLYLYHCGVILAVCSRNDLSDVREVFRGHDGMILREEHIACFCVNWGDKPGNIKEISKRLRIGLESMVFVDDSVAEIEAVRAMLPEVTAIRFERDMDYGQFSCFRLRSGGRTEENGKRTRTYQTDRDREELASRYENYDDYLGALKTRVDIHEAQPAEYGRISELTRRTNKCTNGVRYTFAELRERMGCEGVRCYSVSVSDRFSDLGLVGAIEVEGDALNLFSLSCRALGRRIGEEMAGYILERHRITKCRFQPTYKNGGLKEFLGRQFPGIVFID